MRTVELHHGAATDVGLVRTVNEDAFLVDPPVFVVADGMGGHFGGEVASRIAVEEFARLGQDFDPSRGCDHVVDAFSRAQSRIRDFTRTQRAVPGWHAGTTAVVAVLVEDAGVATWLLANVGDSRIYRVSHGTLDQVSVDHSVIQELLDSGAITPAEAATHPERHVITRALGSPEGIDPDFFLLPLPSVDRLLLCSDGVSGMIDDAQIEQILESIADPRDAADALVKAAVAAGGRDNATAVVVDVVGLAHDDTYDSARQRASLETKLGGLL